MVEKRQKLRGTTAQLNAIVGLDGLLTVDRSRNDLRLFDGVLLGGYRIPNYSAIAAEFVAKVRNINTGNGITGGGNLGADRTLGLTGQALSVHNWNAVGLMWRTGANAYTPVIQGDGLRFVAGTPNTLAVNSTVVRTSRTLTAGDGLDGGGDLTANRSFAVDSTVVRTARTLTAGDGLTGGGTLAADRAFAVNSTVVRTTRTLSTTSPLTGGGNLSANRTLAIDMAALVSLLKNPHGFMYIVNYSLGAGLTGNITNTAGILNITLNLDQVARTFTTISAGNGLTGGGNLVVDRTIALGTPGTLTHNTTNSVTATSHTHSLDPAGVSVVYSQAGPANVGQLAFARRAGASANYGDQITGNALTRSDANNNASGGVLGSSATVWECLGAAGAGVATLYRRIT